MHVKGCPYDACNLVARRVPTERERADAAKPDHLPLDPRWDTAAADQIADFGVLQDCTSCGLQMRVKVDEPAAAPDPRP